MTTTFHSGNNLHEISREGQKRVRKCIIISNFSPQSDQKEGPGENNNQIPFGRLSLARFGLPRGSVLIPFGDPHNVTFNFFPHLWFVAAFG